MSGEGSGEGGDGGGESSRMYILFGRVDAHILTT